jgi:hypothetical protein
VACFQGSDLPEYQRPSQESEVQKVFMRNDCDPKSFGSDTRAHQTLMAAGREGAGVKLL